MLVALAAFAAVLALVDWWAVGTEHRTIELVAKPATMAALVGVAAVVGDPAGEVRAWLVVGALLGLVGDVCLLDTGEPAFLGGLSAFAVGHLAYSAAAASAGFEARWLIPGFVVLAALLGVRFAGRTVPGARERGGNVLAGAVVVYAVVISAMVLSAWGTASLVAGVGASLFAASDWVLGHRRFVGPLPGGRVAVMVPYHVGQALLVVGIATA